MKEMKKRLAACIMFLVLALGTGTACMASEPIPDNYGEPHPEIVHTIYWNAILKRNVKQGKKVVAKAGRSVIVTKRNYGRGKSQIQFGDNNRVWVPNSYLSIRSDHTTISKEGDYNPATKEAFINRKARVKKKKFLIWVSLDKQRINLFRATQGRWELYKVYKCSSGKAFTPTRVGWADVDFKARSVKGLKWYTDVAGGGIHKWPGSLKKSIYGRHTASKGCVRTTEKDAYEIYRTVPVKTRVLVY